MNHDEHPSLLGLALERRYCMVKGEAKGGSLKSVEVVRDALMHVQGSNPRHYTSTSGVFRITQ
ncbi:hypothetical protein FOPG_18647 [Fusarium oxysporum f. sp. conglutinans race 2 54008]|uniref:Uncharacterized protein n=1 Tax=Fusarium oxysporum f. sp. conglutinans race 2 54008 TaxID=1089457 RepID=X0GYY6_FUSOX|nr:hypothetical protein FOPG_18647 [Fusarium oxysporum f. sp. conglutinans race 2 54008]